MGDLGKMIRKRVARALRDAGIEPGSDSGTHNDVRGDIRGGVVQAGSVNSVVTSDSVRIEQATGGVCTGPGYAVAGGFYWLTEPGDVIRGDVLYRGGRGIAGTPVPRKGGRCTVETRRGQMWINGVRIPEYHGSGGGTTRQTM